MNDPKISVCIPVYNGEDFIAEAIDSVLSQSFKDFEILVIDNNSSDGTVELVKKYSDKRIRLIQNETNIGLIPNWNKALNNALGKYIKILPADDLLYQECLKLQYEILEADSASEISLVAARRNIINDKGETLFTRGFSKQEKLVSGFTAISKNIRSGGNIIGEGGSLLFRKDILQKTGVFTSEIFYVLDIDLWYKFLLHGKLYVLPQVLSAFRVSSTSASVKLIKKQYEDSAQFIRKIYKKPEYKIAWSTKQIGLIMVFMLTEAKKILYKNVLK